MRRATVALAVAVAAGCAPAAAHATTVTADPTTITISDSTAGIGLTGSVTVDPVGAGLADDKLVVNGNVTSAPGPGCTPPSNFTTRCDLAPTRTRIIGNFSGNSSEYYWTIDLDRPGSVLTGIFTVAGAGVGQNSLDGSPTDRGPLTLTGRTVTGGGDDDVLVGTNFDNTMVGNGGDDAFAAGFGEDTMIGGPGDDSFGLAESGAITPQTVMIDGGEGTQDSIGFGGHGVPVKISLNDTDDGDVAGSGGARQILQIRGVENASGGKVADVIFGNAGFNHLYGLGGADQIDGGGGGHDVLRGGADNDSIVARDSPALFGDLACGSGADNVVVDAFDLVASDCESVDRSAPDPAAPGGGGGAGGGGAGGAGDPNDRSAPTVSVRGATSRIKRANLLKGLLVTVDPNETARFEASLIGRARRLSLARAGDITVAEGKLGYGDSARRMRLKPSRRLLGRATKLTLLIVATDRSGNERVMRRTVRVTR